MRSTQASAAVVRNRIARYHNPRFRAALAFAFITASRLGEVVCRNKPSERPAHGPNGDALSFSEHDGHEVAIFRLYVQKRGAERYRNCPIPVDPKFEPFAPGVISAFEKAGPDPVFDCSRDYLRRKAAYAFKGLYYDVDAYERKYEGVEKPVTVKPHPALFRMHGLRHVRIADLINNYEMTLQQVNQFVGYSMRGLGVSGALERYANLEWQNYVGKLFKPSKPASNSTRDIGEVLRNV